MRDNAYRVRSVQGLHHIHKAKIWAGSGSSGGKGDFVTKRWI